MRNRFVYASYRHRTSIVPVEYPQKSLSTSSTFGAGMQNRGNLTGTQCSSSTNTGSRSCATRQDGLQEEIGPEAVEMEREYGTVMHACVFRFV